MDCWFSWNIFSKSINFWRLFSNHRWKSAAVHVNEADKLPREIDKLLTIMKFPPKRRRFPPHREPGPEIMNNLPPLSMQFPVPAEQQAVLHEYKGRLIYLKRRNGIPLPQRFVQPPNINATYGWNVVSKEGGQSSGELTTENKFGHNPVLADEFYRSAGVINARKNSTMLDITTKWRGRKNERKNESQWKKLKKFHRDRIFYRYFFSKKSTRKKSEINTRNKHLSFGDCGKK